MTISWNAKGDGYCTHLFNQKTPTAFEMISSIKTVQCTLCRSCRCINCGHRMNPEIRIVEIPGKPIEINVYCDGFYPREIPHEPQNLQPL